ncbi:MULTISPECIES: OsmC family protein [Thioclava]|uniref:OsmC family protein n=1 Tax=Thioclava TaxID=285107 RepID=UPI000998A9D4|nr:MULTISPECIES: OsmC family protein [Thioclava]MAQ39237.1 peroxiredoxin [Thioclava sp.]OOY06296.1 OsmC family peroxiredoxin [Thioclava sp. F28-4]OOY09356.1 OsmC family peroxiredoxin [Thioclava sp. F36-7]OOY21420.1 OsmC family peroxiredoxin [Thioclava sp. DLFJ5-1]OOY33200.1 OsmC family peroxiredoxin [Thioclava sp. F36-6]
MIRKHASAHWEGTIKGGKGTISTESGALKSQPYGFNTRFEDEPGSNPEELIGAAHASCFSMALSLQLEQAGVSDVVIDTKAEISLDKEGDGFAVKKSALTSTVKGTGDEEAIRKAAEGAKEGCPISKLLNCEITLDLTIN